MTETVAALLAGVVIVLGIVGTVVPLLPGSFLVAVGVVGYAVIVSDPIAWAGAGIALLVLGIGLVSKWVVPARTVGGDVCSIPLVGGAGLAVSGGCIALFLGRARM